MRDYEPQHPITTPQITSIDDIYYSVALPYCAFAVACAIMSLVAIKNFLAVVFMHSFLSVFVRMGPYNILKSNPYLIYYNISRP